MRMRTRTMLFVAVLAACTAGAGFHLARVAAAGEGRKDEVLGPQELLVREVRGLRGRLEKLDARVAALERGQRESNRRLALLLSCRWEYRVESVFGGDSRTRLAARLERMGRMRFEYAGRTADGLYVFKRRAAPRETE